MLIANLVVLLSNFVVLTNFKRPDCFIRNIYDKKEASFCNPQTTKIRDVKPVLCNIF